MILQRFPSFPLYEAALLKAAVRDVAGVVTHASLPSVWDSRRAER